MSILFKQTKFSDKQLIIDTRVLTFDEFGLLKSDRPLANSMPSGKFVPVEVYSYLINYASYLPKGVCIGAINTVPYREFVKYTDSNSFKRLKLVGSDSVKGKQIIEQKLQIKPLIIKRDNYVQYLYPKTRA